MKLLISPRSPLPIQVKALFRWLLWRLDKRALSRFDYGDGVPHWDGGYHWHDQCVCFEDNEGGLFFRW